MSIVNAQSETPVAVADPRWSPTGHLVVTRDDDRLWAVPIDPATRRPSGSAVPLGVPAGHRVNQWPKTALSEHGIVRFPGAANRPE